MSGRRVHRESTFRRTGEISGLNAAVEKLRAMGEDVLLAAKFELAEGVKLIVSDAKSRCPVKTGKLRESIKAVDLGNGEAYELSADARNANGIAYGQFVEFSPKINKPFLYPAIEKYYKYIKRNIDAAVEEAVRGRYGYRTA